ncbi:MAG: ABC transporter permease [Acidobacteria bacterium]|nr:ABC transporter permease [Acidobacteriota bacterium]
MHFTLTLAWRNLWRHRRRTWITVSAVVFALWIITLSRSLQYGSYNAIESSAISLVEGDLQIASPTYFEDHTINQAFALSNLPTEALNSDKIVQWSPRIAGFGLVSSDASSAGAAIFGIVPEKEPDITRFAGNLVAGEPLNSDQPNQALIGKTLARQLELNIGDEFAVITQGYRNAMGAETFVVSGMISLGSPELDRGIAVLTLKGAQNLFVVEDAATQVAVKTHYFREAETVANELNRLLEGTKLTARSWQQIMPDLEQMVAWDNVSGAILLAFLILVVGFEILNTAMMSVVERRREFGILQAIGLNQQQLAGLLAIEFILKIVLSVGLGLFVSWLTLTLIKPYPLPLSQELKDAMSIWGELPNIYFSTELKVFLEPLISVTSICLLAIIYPVVLALKSDLVDAMRQG